MPKKKLNGGPFGIFQHPFTKKLKGDPLRKFFLKTKSHNAGKKLKREPFSPARYCRLRGKTAKTFLEKNFFEKRSHDAEKN